MPFDFSPTNGWMWRWKRREGIKFTKITGEAADAVADSYRRRILQNLLKNYEPCNVFNADESGLLYKALPNGTLARKGTTVTGGKSQKMRLTLLFCCNADGSEKKYIPLENQKILAAIKGKSYPFHIIFRVKLGWTNILKEFDRDMIKQNRKVVLFIDNAPCHKVTDLVLENVKIEFLPANTTSILQPLDQGIIHAFKVYFRQILVRKQLLAIEKGLSNKDFVKSISILDALTFAKRAWWLVKKETIENCFRKGGFFIENNSSDVVEEVIDVTIDPTEFEEYVNCDKELECFGTLTEDEIVSSLLDENSSEASSEENSEGECNDVPPTLVAAIGALSTVKHFMESKNLYLDEIESLEEKLFKCYFQTHHQKKITDFFIV